MDRLRDLSTRQIAEKATAAHRAAYATARRNLELVMVYAITQLAMWLSKSDLDASAGCEMDVEEPQMSESQRGDTSKDRKATRTPLPLAERLRRGMDGEITSDLDSLLKRAKSVFQEEDPKKDLAQVLMNFFQSHLA